MREKFRFRGQDPQHSGRDWTDPLGSRGEDDELIRSLGGGSDFRLGDIEPARSKIPIEELVGVENLGFIAADREITSRMDLVANGTRKQRETAQKYLVDRGTHGTINDLLDVTNAALVSVILIRNPRSTGVLENVGVKPEASTDALRNLKGFLIDFTRGLSRESRTYYVDLQMMSTSTKIVVASNAVVRAASLYSQDEIGKLPVGFKSLADILMSLTLDALPETKTAKFSVATELTDNEIIEISEVSQKDPDNISQREFELALKVNQSWPGLRLSDSGDKVLSKLFEGSQPRQIAHALEFFNNSINSPDSAVKNRAIRTLFSPVRINREVPLAIAQLKWLSSIQRVIERMSDGDETLDGHCKTEIEALIINTARIDKRMPLNLLHDYEDITSRLGNMEERPKLGIFMQSFNEKLILKLDSSQAEIPALELLLRTFREYDPGQIEEEALLELFDERRPLGYFLDNLRANWQDLQKITRGEMWPSFITARQAKLWPSERELDVLEFSRRHPAEVLGFSGIRFFTRGHTPPEAGLEFTFKQTENVLRGRITGEGHLADLPFDVEENNPHIHALLEHFAVGSFQELVTIADKRIKEKGQESRATAAVPVEHTGEVTHFPQKLPRREITYITVSKHYEPQVAQSDEVIEQASERERLPRLIPQKVVPLAYAQRYRFLSDRLQAARESGVTQDELKDLEGQVLYARSLIPKPSDKKLDNLPEQFQLEQTGDGKFLDTWRVAHFRPKPKEGEEPSLSEVFEKRFRAAPIALTKHLETWFTQPPKPS